jgi:hypothetical protein
MGIQNFKSKANFMVHTPHREDDSSLASQEIPRLLETA